MILNQTLRTLFVSATLVAPCMFVAPHVVWAADGDECATDADCGAGSECQKAWSISGCSSDAPDCDSTPRETETGYCSTLPQACTADADCGEYEECVVYESGACWVSADGSSGCDEPDPDAYKYCSPKTFECTSDADCPREFECQESTICLDIACAEESDCENACQTQRQCQPKQIECETDAACPSDWSCVGTTQWECSGGGSSDGGGATEPAPADHGADAGEATEADDADDAEDTPSEPDERPGPAPEDVGEECVDVPAVGHCQPNAWEGVYFAEDGSATGGDTPVRDDVDSPNGAVDEDAAENPKGEVQQESASEGDGDAGDEAGCSVAKHPGSSSSWLWLTLLAIPLMRRKRAVPVSR